MSGMRELVAQIEDPVLRRLFEMLQSENRALRESVAMLGGVDAATEAMLGGVDAASEGDPDETVARDPLEGIDSGGLG